MEEVTADYHGHCLEGLQSNLQSLKGNVTLLRRPPPILPENGPLLKKGTCKGTLCWDSVAGAIVYCPSGFATTESFCRQTLNGLCR